VPFEIRDIVADRLGALRADTVQAKSTHAPGVYEIKIHGYPWMAIGEEAMRTREMLLILMEVLEEEGWTVYASIDQKSTGGDQGETDTVSWQGILPALR
jgi:hypothetical protein